MKKAILLILAVVLTSTIMAQAVDFNIHTSLKGNYFNITIEVTSGTAPFQYYVNKDSQSVYQSSPCIEGLSYDTPYTVSVKDSNNNKTNKVLFVENPHFTWDISRFAYCGGDESSTWQETGIAIKIYDIMDRDNFLFHWYDISTGLEVDCVSHYEGYMDSAHAYVKTLIPVYDPNFNGNYAVHVKDTAHDMDTVVFVNVNGNLLLGINDLEEIPTINVYPNPTTERLFFSKMVNDVKIISSDGRIILTKKNTNEVDVSSLPTGVYFVRMDNLTKKVIKK